MKSPCLLFSYAFHIAGFDIDIDDATDEETILGEIEKKITLHDK